MEPRKLLYVNVYTDVGFGKDIPCCECGSQDDFVVPEYLVVQTFSDGPHHLELCSRCYDDFLRYFEHEYADSEAYVYVH